MKAETIRKSLFGVVLVALATVCLAFSPAAKAQSQLEYTPVPVVIANVCSADFVDTETQPHILVAFNLDPAPDFGGGIQPVPPTLQPPMFQPPTYFAHTVVFPSGDSVLVDRGTVMQIAVTATTELALQPADDTPPPVMFPPPNP